MAGHFHTRLLPLTVVALALSYCSSSDPAPARESNAVESDTGRGRVETTLAETRVSVEYGRPELDAGGRIRGTEATPSEMRAEREAGFVWRLGRNEATTLTTTGPLRFGDFDLPAGRYALFARKEEAQRWSLLFNTEHDQWGSFDYDPARDLGAVPLRITAAEEPVRRLSAELSVQGEQGRLEFQWGHDRLAVEFVTPQ